MRHRIEPLVDGAMQLRLPPGQHVAHRLDAHRGLRLQPRQLGHLLIGCLDVAPAQRPHRDDAAMARERREAGDNDAVQRRPDREGCRSWTQLYIDSDHKNKK